MQADHAIAKGRELTAAELDYIAQVWDRWLREQEDGQPEARDKQLRLWEAES